LPISIALFATGTLAAIALALTFALEKGWLTIALALMSLGTAWISMQRPIPFLRSLAAILAGIVVLRIGYEPRIVGDAVGTTPIFNWLLFGYGAPAIAFGLGWSPHASALAFLTVPLLVLAGTAAFSGLALLMAGALRAEATLALANLIYIALLGLGGVVFPLTKFPAAAHPYLTLLPTGALATGLRSVLAHAAGVPVRDLIVLVVWAVLGIGLAARTFRWE